MGSPTGAVGVGPPAVVGVAEGTVVLEGLAGSVVEGLLGRVMESRGRSVGLVDPVGPAPPPLHATSARTSPAVSNRRADFQRMAERW